MRGFIQLAQSDSSALVRLALACALQRLPVAQRAQLAKPLLSHPQDANDHNLPLMLWYGVEPLANAPNVAFENLIAGAKIVRVQRLAARRLAEDIDLVPERVNALLLEMSKNNRTLESRQAVLDGIAQALSGRRKAPRPASWTQVSTDLARVANEALGTRLRDLSALFGDGRALGEIRAVALNSAADLPQRRSALEVLIESRAPDLHDVAVRLLGVRGLSATAASGLALSDDSSVANLLLAEWPNLYGDERPPVMSVLVSRPAWASITLEALAAGRLQRASINAFQARQIRAYRDPGLTKRLEELWGGSVDESEKDRDAALAKWEPRFTADILAQADKANGRAVFRSVCAACHTLNGEGGPIGPDLTGGARENRAYLLENLLFPSTVVADDYRLTTLTLNDGRVLSGMVRARTTHTLKLQSMTELVVVATADVATEETFPMSLMPPGLLDSLSASDASDLMAYLMAK